MGLVMAQATFFVFVGAGKLWPVPVSERRTSRPHARTAFGSCAGPVGSVAGAGVLVAAGFLAGSGGGSGGGELLQGVGDRAG